MSVLIKGMEMPKNCDECRIMVFEDTNCVPELFCGCPIVFKSHPQGVGHRPDYCPLVEVPEQMKWIPVTERLPEDRQRVLAITLYKTRPRSSYYRLVYFSNNLESVDNFDFEGESRSGFYYYDSEYGFCEVDDVSHWMPLPQPPESEDEEDGET